MKGITHYKGEEGILCLGVKEEGGRKYINHVNCIHTKHELHSTHTLNIIGIKFRFVFIILVDQSVLKLK